MIERGLSLLAVMLATAAQSPSTPPPEAQSRAQQFGIGAEMVLVDAVVTDKKGKPVLDLTLNDFRVSEDGVEREIVSFVAFGGTAAPPQAAPSDGLASKARPVTARAPAFLPASTVVLIDEGHMTVTEAMRLEAFFAKILGDLAERRGGVLVLAPWSKVAYAGNLPTDAAMLAEAVNHRRGQRFPVITTRPITDAEAFDIDRGDTQALARVVARFKYLNPGLGDHTPDVVRNQATEQIAEERARRGDTFEAMRIGFAWLSKQPGRRTFLLVTSGFPYEAGDRGFNEMMNLSLRLNTPVHFLDVAAMQSDPNFEGIQYRHALGPEARVSLFDHFDSSAGSDQLAVNTGGLRIAESDIDRAFQQVIDATRLYYVLGYEPSAKAKPGFRRIKVEVKRKDVRVRARRGYFDPGPAPAPTPTPRAFP